MHLITDLESTKLQAERGRKICKISARVMAMNRALIFAQITNLLLSGCSREQADQLAGQPQSPTDGAWGGPSLAAAVSKVTDACSLAPADLAPKLVHGVSPPQSEQFPRRRPFSNWKSALGIAIDTGLAELIKGAEFIPGLAEGGYLEGLHPASHGDAYLTVVLGKGLNGTNRNLHVEVAGHDGKDHKDDTIAVARDILTRLR
jgi:hypothetical protein